MAAQIQIDQERQTFGVPGTSRTDGDDDGSIVTLTNTGSGSTTTFRLLWTPPGDTTAVATLAPTEEDPKVWTFEPTPERYGSYLIELIEDEGLVTEVRERRVWVVRTPVKGLVIPALNERGDPRASLVLAGTAQLEAAVNNSVDYTSDTALNDVPYAAWWRSLHELTMAVDASAINPFLHTRYVDGRTSVAPLQQVGSIDRPFSSLQAAIDDIPTTVDGYTPVGGVLLITGYSYVSEAIALSTSMVLAGLGSGNNADIPAARAVIGDVDAAFFEVEFRDVTVAGSVSNTGSARATGCSFFGAVSVNFGLTVKDCSFSGGLTADNLFAENCTITGDLAFTNAEVFNSLLLVPIVTGALVIDKFTYERSRQAGTDFSGATVQIVDRAGTLSPPVDIEVDVPELGGSGIVFVDATTTATALEGIDVPQLVLANPTDDTGGDLYRNVYVSGPNTLRFALTGPFAGGPVTFRVSVVY